MSRRHLFVDVRQPKVSSPRSDGHQQQALSSSDIPQPINSAFSPTTRRVETMIWRPTESSSEGRNYRYANNNNSTTITSTSMQSKVTSPSHIVNTNTKEQQQPRKKRQNSNRTGFPVKRLNPRFEINMNRYKAEYQFVLEQLRTMEDRFSHAREDSPYNESFDDGESIRVGESLLEEYRTFDSWDTTPPVPPLPSVPTSQQLTMKRAQSAQSVSRPKSVLSTSQRKERPQSSSYQPAGIHRTQLHDTTSFAGMTTTVKCPKAKQLFHRASYNKNNPQKKLFDEPQVYQNANSSILSEQKELPKTPPRRFPRFHNVTPVLLTNHPSEAAYEIATSLNLHSLPHPSPRFRVEMSLVGLKILIHMKKS